MLDTQIGSRRSLGVGTEMKVINRDFGRVLCSRPSDEVQIVFVTTFGRFYYIRRCIFCLGGFSRNEFECNRRKYQKYHLMHAPCNIVSSNCHSHEMVQNTNLPVSQILSIGHSTESWRHFIFKKAEKHQVGKKYSFVQEQDSYVMPVV